MSEDAAILNALCDHLESIVAGDKDVEIVFPSQAKYQPKAKIPYIAARFIPNETRTPFLSNTSAAIFEGEFRLTVHMPSVKGEVKARELASRVICHFKRGTSLNWCGLVVKIKHRPSQAPAITTADRVSIPVSVRYFASKSYKDLKE